jgi:hypothetical protein
MLTTYVKFVRYNLTVSYCRHVCNCKHIRKVSFKIYRYACDHVDTKCIVFHYLSPSNRFRAADMLFYTLQKSYDKLHFFKIYLHKSRDSSVGIALGYGLDNRGSRVRFSGGGWVSFCSPPCSERLWGPPSLLSNGYQGLFRWG